MNRQHKQPEPSNDNAQPFAAPKAKTVRDFARSLDACRRRGTRRGLAARYALKNLPPVEEDLP